MSPAFALARPLAAQSILHERHRFGRRGGVEERGRHERRLAFGNSSAA